MFYQWKDSVLLIDCRIQTRASVDDFAAITDERLKIRLKAAPVDGEANAELLRFLSRQFKVPRDHIKIISGTTSRLKRIAIEQPGNLPPVLGIKGSSE